MDWFGITIKIMVYTGVTVGLLIGGIAITNRVDFSLIRELTDEGTSKCINSMEGTAISQVINENVAGPTEAKNVFKIAMLGFALTEAVGSLALMMAFSILYA